MTLNVGSQLGKYELLESRGSGNFGTVYRSHDRATNSECALKCIRVPDIADIANVLLEARALRACACQHIVRVNTADIYQDGAEHYVCIEMEYLADGSVESKAGGAGLNYNDVLTATRHMLLGLSAAHDAGIIHRDVKPANIMVAGRDYKLSDFGIAHITSIAVGPGLTYTPHAAPEVLNGGASTTLSDVYAAGLTLYRMTQLSGDIRIDRAEFNEWRRLGMRENLPSFLGLPQHLPRRLKSVILRATSLNPGDRFQSAPEMLNAIEALRVNMPWGKTSPRRWEAEKGNQTHSVELLASKGHWELEYKINDRRRSANCSTHKTGSIASSALNKLISSTVLA